jgi:uncharacterized protein YdhG (YjbR/CyaY superfamily)
MDKTKRESFFPAIEKRYGEPMSYWFTQMKKVKEKKYPEQIAFLRENYGFSQAHANALVMFTRGSKSSRRFQSPKEYFDSLPPAKAKKAREIFRVIRAKYPKMKMVIAWNQPMLKFNDAYVFGLSAATNYLLIAPFDARVIRKLSRELKGYETNKKTIRIPLDWKVDRKLLHSIIQETLLNQSKAK